MIKKLNFFLSFIIFTLVIFSFNNILNGININNALYKNTKEFHIIYDSKTDYSRLLSDLTDQSIHSNSNVSQYNFSSKNSLNIISTNPKANKYFRLNKGTFPEQNSNTFISNKSNKSEKNIGNLDLYSNYLELNVFSINQFKNVGIGNVFYVQGNYDLIEKTLKKYGKVEISSPTKSETFSINSYIYIIIIYISLIIFLCLLTLAFSQKKRISLKKTFGYSNTKNLLESTKQINSIFYGLLISIIIFIISSKKFNMNAMISVILPIFIFILFLCFYFAVQTFLFYTDNIKYTIKGKRPLLVTTIVLSSLLCIVLFISFSISVKGIEDWQKYTKLKTSTKILESTKNLYKTNITNQLNRNSSLEERIYLRNAQNFYEDISKKRNTFIIAPYNYEIIRYKKNKKITYVGQDRSLNKYDYITNPGGIDITIDINYLKKNPIDFMSPSDEKNINGDKNTLYILVPNKYKKYESVLKTNYLDDLKFRIEEDPPNQNISIENLKIKLIYVKDNQKYFTYNSYYGDSNSSNLITDPISVIVNPNLMSGLFWGNILTANGGLFLSFENETEPFNIIKKDLSKNGLNNIVNFTISVFNEYGEYLSKIQTTLLNISIQLIILIVLLLILNFQITSLIFNMQLKKSFIKKIIGYSTFQQIINIVKIPIILEVLTLIIFCIYNKISLNIFIPTIFVIVSINFIIYTIIDIKYKRITLKESLYDI